MKILCKFLTKFSKFLTNFKQSVNFQGFAKCEFLGQFIIASGFTRGEKRPPLRYYERFFKWHKKCGRVSLRASTKSRRGVCVCLLALAQIHTLQAVRFCHFKKGVNLKSVSKNGKFHSFLTIDCRANFAYLFATTFLKFQHFSKRLFFKKVLILDKVPYLSF